MEIEQRVETLKERRSNIWNFARKNYIWLIYILLIIVLIVNVQIRLLPMETNSNTGKPGLWDIAADDWTLGPDLDPYVFLRGAERIVEDGSLGEVDMMRFYPLGYNTAGETKILPYSIYYIHKIFVFLGVGPGTVMYAAILLPVIFSVLTALAFFLLVRKIFEERGKLFSNVTALISTAFLVTLPSLLPRTIAGIPEKEAMGFTFMFFALYFFISAWKSRNKTKNIILASLSGIFTALMGLVWGGVIFVYIAIAISGFIVFLMGKVTKRNLAVYWLWLISSMAFWIPFTARMTIEKFMRSSTTGAAVVVAFLMLVFYVSFKGKYSRFVLSIKDKTPWVGKLPRSLYTIIMTLIILLVLSSVTLGPTTMYEMGKDVGAKLTQPYTSRIAFTVAENKQPYYSDWRSNMGPIVGGFPLFFWLFIFGSVALFYEVIKNYRAKERTILSLSYVIFLFALIFSRSSPSDILNGETGVSLILYTVGYLVLLGGIGYVGYKRWKAGKDLEVDANIGYIFVFSLVFVGIIAGRSAIRLLMVLTALAVIPLSYFIVHLVVEATKKRKEEVVKILLVCVAIIAVIFGLMILNYQYRSVQFGGKNHIPSSYSHQWQYAMKWVRDNTPEDSVFGHWWDYGYWLQSIGRRATMLDGGNSIPYWNYLMGRHGLTAESEEEALELFYTHELTHFLIDSSEIGKYAAYSSIGSDEEYDRFSWIGTFHLDPKQVVESKNDTKFVYMGGIAVDEDIIINGTLLPSNSAGIGAMILPVDNNDSTLLQPSIIAVYNGQQHTIPLRYAWFEGALVDFESGIEGCAYIFPRFQNNLGYDPKGSAFYISPRNMRALWVQMYLFDNVENFELVHTEPSAVVKSLRAQGLPSADLIFFNGIQGPIKIWEIEYTGDEQVNEEYLLLDFPERIIERKSR